MELVQIQNEVPKSAKEMAEGLVDLISVVQKALADGLQLGQDLPVIAIESLKDLPKIVSGLSELKKNLDYDKGKVILALINEFDRVL